VRIDSRSARPCVRACARPRWNSPNRLTLSGMHKSRCRARFGRGAAPPACGPPGETDPAMMASAGLFGLDRPAGRLDRSGDAPVEADDRLGEFGAPRPHQPADAEHLAARTSKLMSWTAPSSVHLPAAPPPGEPGACGRTAYQRRGQPSAD
jgi:hypothetical protein